MECLSIEKIYLYLEKELLSSETKEIDYHLSHCRRCREAVEERSLLLQAVGSLPSIEMPADFAQRTMSRILPVKVTPLGWLTAFSIGFSGFLLSSLIYLLVTGQSLPSLLHGFLNTALEQGKNLSLFVKLYKLVSMVFRAISSLVGQLGDVFQMITTLISSEVQIILLAAFSLITALAVYGLRRVFALGEKK